MKNVNVISAFVNGETRFNGQVAKTRNLYIDDNKLINYGTVIAIRKGHANFLVNVTKYSKSTSTIQNMLIKWLPESWTKRYEIKNGVMNFLPITGKKNKVKKELLVQEMPKYSFPLFQLNKQVLSDSLKIMLEDVLSKGSWYRENNGEVLANAGYTLRSAMFSKFVSDNHDGAYVFDGYACELDHYDEFRDHMYPVVLRYYRERDRHGYMSDEYKKWDLMYWFADYVRDYVTHEDIMKNRVNETIAMYIKTKEIKGFSSPKLSKLLTKLAGEQDPLIKWYTNDVVRGVAEGDQRLPEYKVVCSVLPHHIAGMSYWSCYNFGGDEWDGANGTSCQDMSRSYASGVSGTLRDSMCAIAYLTDADHYEQDGVSKPYMLARTLVRVAMVGEKVVYIGSRFYGTERGVHSSILEASLRKEFKGHFTTADQVYPDSYYDSKNVVYENNNVPNAQFTLAKNDTCGSCGGSGKGTTYCDQCGGRGNTHLFCSDCEGSGYHTVLDEDGNTTYSMCDTCSGAGSTTSTECEKCKGKGRKPCKCTRCNGKGKYSYIEVQEPYIDDSCFRVSGSYYRVRMSKKGLINAGIIEDDQTQENAG